MAHDDDDSTADDDYSTGSASGAIEFLCFLALMTIATVLYLVIEYLRSPAGG